MRKKIVSMFFAVTLLCGCGSGLSRDTASAMATVKERGIPAKRAGLKTAMIPLKQALSSDVLLESGNEKESEARVSASVSSAKKKNTQERPENEDFDWLNKVTNIQEVPSGAKVLSSPSEISGDWKVMMIGADNEYYWFTSILNMDFDFAGNSTVSVTADWYRSCEISKKTGESKTYDESKDADTVYKGSMIDGSVYVSDQTSDRFSRYLFVSGERIYDFLFLNWYEKGGKQYGLGTFNSENEYLGTVALVRNKGAVPVPEEESTASEWAQFEGYWVFEDDHDPEDLWDDELNSIYIKAAGPDRAFIHVDDEMWGSCIYDIKLVEYDPKYNSITLTNIEAGTVDSELQIDTYNGEECLYVVGHTDVPFLRRKKDERSWLSWDSVNEDYQEVKAYYDGLKQ